ncbi:MAG: AEC family transporter, partial [Propionibacteriaceae bacterium]|nr:AEC family transporter [Propionibacteriaceae bacterium]
VISVVATVALHRSLADRTIATLLACYTNAGNLGIPVAAYALRDVTWVVPVLLIQVVVLQPVALAILDWQRARDQGRRPTVAAALTLPFRNPLTVGVLLGLGLNLLGRAVPGATPPAFVTYPVELLGNAAIPLMLLAFGVSIRLDPKPAHGAEAVESWCLVALKVLVQPVLAFGLATLLHLGPAARYAVTIVACLPAAQNIFVFATRYDVRLVFARDTIFRGTLVSAGVILVAAVVLA